MYRVGENGYVADVIVGTRKNGSAVLYDLVNIYEKEIAEDHVTMASNNSSQRRHDTSATDIIPQNPKKSSGSAKFSLSDSDGKQLTKEQSEYFKDSKMRDDNGNLKVMYKNDCFFQKLFQTNHWLRKRPQNKNKHKKGKKTS